MRWFKRIDAMGHGDMKGMDPDEALKIARESTPAAAGMEEPRRSQRLQARGEGRGHAGRLWVRSGSRQGRGELDL